MKYIVFCLFVVASLISCKTTDKFSVHQRRYNSGYYFEKNRSHGNSKIAEVVKPLKSGCLSSSYPAPHLDVTVSNSINKIELVRQKTHPKKQKVTFSEIQGTHFLTFLNGGINLSKGTVLDHNVSLQKEITVKHSITNEKHQGAYSKANSGGGNFGVGGYFLAGILYLFAVFIMYMGYFSLLAGIYSGRPELMLLGVLLFIIGIGIIGVSSVLVFR